MVPNCEDMVLIFAITCHFCDVFVDNKNTSSRVSDRSVAQELRRTCSMIWPKPLSHERLQNLQRAVQIRTRSLDQQRKTKEASQGILENIRKISGLLF